MSNSYRFGDYVVYDNHELGRVARCMGDTVFVCYHSGCTAAATTASMLRLASSTEISQYQGEPLGYHRFDIECPDCDPEVCRAYCPNKTRKEVQ